MTDTDREDRLERLRNTAGVWLGANDPSVATGALVEAAFLMAAADGELTAIEQQQLTATIEHVIPNVSAERVQSMVAQLLSSLESDGWEARIAAIAQSLPDPEWRRNAYRLAAGVSFIDGEVQESEARLFGLMAQAFEIPEAEASWILSEVRDELFGPQPTDPPAV